MIGSSAETEDNNALFFKVSARAKKRWKALRAEVSVVPEDTTKSPDDPSQQHNVFYQLCRGVNHLFSRPHGK